MSLPSWTQLEEHLYCSNIFYQEEVDLLQAECSWAPHASYARYISWTVQRQDTAPVFVSIRSLLIYSRLLSRHFYHSAVSTGCTHHQTLHLTSLKRSMLSKVEAGLAQIAADERWNAFGLITLLSQCSHSTADTRLTCNAFESLHLTHASFLLHALWLLIALQEEYMICLLKDF